jgi:putative sigma-54 modulation protein
MERIDDMKFNIHGKKIDVTDSIKSYIEEKIGRLDKYFENPDEITATVLIKLRGKDQVVEVTINANKFILRGEESHKDLYASIDKVSDKIERQIRKNKTRLNKQNYDSKYKEFNFDYTLEPEEESSEEELIVKRKKLEMKPMDEEEAIMQMNLLGHAFFVFKNCETDSISVVYQRKDGNYGIIDTK